MSQFKICAPILKATSFESESKGSSWVHTTTAVTAGLSLSNISTLFCNTATAAQTLTGFTQGTAGQRVTITNIHATLTVTITHVAAALPTQGVLLPNDTSVILAPDDAITLVCDATNWYAGGVRVVTGSTLTHVTNGLTANLNVAGRTAIFCNGTAAQTLTGLAGGIAGQKLTITNIDAVFTVTVSHAAAGALPVLLPDDTDIILAPTGTVDTISLICDGTSWYMSGHSATGELEYVAPGAASTISIAGVKTVQIDNTIASALAIANLSGGIEGQVVHFYVITATNTFTFTHAGNLVGVGGANVVLNLGTAKIMATMIVGQGGLYYVQ